MRRRKAFSAAATLAVALCIVPAAAQAGTLMSEGEAYPVALEGFRIEKASTRVTQGASTLTAECKKATFTGTLSAASSEVRLHPVYSECTAFGFIEATVKTEGCDYIGHIGEKVGEAWTTTADVACEAGKAIEITAGTCQMKIGSQKGLKSIELTNMAGTPQDVTGNFALRNVRQATTKDGFACPLQGVGEFENFDVDGLATLTGKLNGEPIGLTVE
ncbi:MAG TPA: hypothetical protein VHI77_09295 [Solirubrobacterales bacterium]|jgi:hypothetical protein|nr:hypothetical protein [Solirubrobacterales bacterium]